MIDILDFKSSIKKKEINNSYIFVGQDEYTMKENIKIIMNKCLDKEFKDLNYIKFDGGDLEEFDPVYNACETMPFMSEKKIVLVYRANFLSDNKSDSKTTKLYNSINKYIDKLPSHCVFIMYLVMNNKRDKIGSKIKKLDKKCTVVKVDNIKGGKLEQKIQKMFSSRGKNIERVPLKSFVHNMKDNNLNIIENEVEKICSYTLEKDIEKKHINIMYDNSVNDDDIFDLINLISEKKAKDAVGLLNQLTFKGQKITHILAMMEKQFRNLYLVKVGVESRKTKEQLAHELRIHPYGCSILIRQSKKFTLRQIERAMNLCLEADRKIKTTTANPNTEVEILIINSTYS